MAAMSSQRTPENGTFSLSFNPFWSNSSLFRHRQGFSIQFMVVHSKKL